MAHLPRRVAGAIGATPDLPADHWTPAAIDGAVVKLDEYAAAHALRPATVKQYRAALRVYLREQGVTEKAICQRATLCTPEQLWKAYAAVSPSVRDLVWSFLADACPPICLELAPAA